MSGYPGPLLFNSALTSTTNERTLQVVLLRARHDPILLILASFALTVTACVTIVSTYGIFSGTADEPATISAGMEWLARGTYRIDNTHPPLARIAVALWPYVHGLRLPQDSNDWKKVGIEILYARGEYSRNLRLARAGVLPFFIGVVAVVWFWSRKALGGVGALLAVLVLCTIPPLLGNAGMATTDVVLTATVSASLFALMYCLDRPTYGRGCLLGLAVGLAILSKFSALVFLPVCGAAMLACRFRTRYARIAFAARLRHKPATLLLTAAVALSIVWAGYRFSYHIVDKITRPHRGIDHVLGTHGILHDMAYLAAEHIPIPAPELFKGISFQYSHNAIGSGSYLFGEAKQGGWWYFFPVVLAIKSPLPFLVLVVIGFVWLGVIGVRRVDARVLAAAAAAVVMLLSAMPTRIDLGVRLILPIYPLLAIVAAFGALNLWRKTKPKLLGRMLVVGLLVWQVVSCVHAYPDYLAYFNPIAGNSPERIVVGSDLDWGQDLFRLCDVLRADKVDSLSIAYLGAAELRRHNLPEFVELEPFRRTTGWIAISKTRLMRGSGAPPYYGYSWLRACKPVDHAGKSISIYYVRPGDSCL